VPFKSQAQKEKFLQRLAKGEITQEEYDLWEKGTKSKLPERVPPKGRSSLIGLESGTKKRKR
jgi:hypothetical protein